MPEKNYHERDVLDKLGICSGQIIAFMNTTEKLGPDLLQRVIERTGRTGHSVTREDEAIDIVLAGVDGSTDVVALLQEWRAYIKPNGSIWLLTSKRGQPDYVDQRTLILAGQQAGVVDNKICAISSTVSAMRFVIPKVKR
jgi:hypothetical protein